MNYIVMECHLSYAVVLDEDGRFLKVANRNYQPGQIVTDVIEMIEPDPVVAQGSDNKTSVRRDSRKPRSVMYAVAAMAACVALVISSVFFMDQKTYASVFISINPRVRVDVNKQDTVVGLTGVNEDGKELIADYDYKKKKLDTVMDELVDLAIEKGYLVDGGSISLTFDSDDEEWISGHKGALRYSLEEYLKATHHMSVGISEQEEGDEGENVPSGGKKDADQNHDSSAGNSSGSHRDWDEDDDRDDEDDEDEDDDRDEDDEDGNDRKENKTNSVKSGKTDSSSSKYTNTQEIDDEDDDCDEDDEDEDDEDEDEDDDEDEEEEDEDEDDEEEDD